MVFHAVKTRFSIAFCSPFSFYLSSSGYLRHRTVRYRQKCLHMKAACVLWNDRCTNEPYEYIHYTSTTHIGNNNKNAERKKNKIKQRFPLSWTNMQCASSIIPKTISLMTTHKKIYPKLIKKKKTQKKECGPIGIAMYHTTADHCYYRDAAPFAIRTVKTWTQWTARCSHQCSWTTRTPAIG